MRGEGRDEGESPRAEFAESPPHPPDFATLRRATSPRKWGEVHRRSSMPARQPEPGPDFGDLGAADGNAMRRRSVELDDRAVALLADEGHMRDRHDVAAVHPDEQAGVELGLGLRNRPWAHPLAGAITHPGIMRIRAHAANIRRIDKVS